MILFIHNLRINRWVSALFILFTSAPMFRIIILSGLVALSVGCRSTESDTKFTHSQLAVSTCDTGLSFAVEIAEDYNRLFYREDGWTGSDIAFSLPLLDGRILWLFGDTWIGKIRQGRHTDSNMVSNTIGIQQGLDPATAHLEFFHSYKDAKPAAFIRPADGIGVFWLSHGGIHTDSGLYIFL